MFINSCCIFFAESYSQAVTQTAYNFLSVDEALDSYPKIILKDTTVVYHGKMIKSDLTGQVAICDDNKHVLAIYESNGEGYLKNVRGLW